MADYHETNDVSNKAILQQLQDESEDPDITAIIGCYNIGSSGADIRKQLNRFKIDPLKKSAIHLGLYPKGDTAKGKPAIITDILGRLNSLLMDLCGICGDYFHTELKDKPLFKCLICHQGCHTKCFNPIDTMFRQLDETHRIALQFICTSCYKDHNDEEEDTDITVNAPKVKKSPTKPSKSEPVAIISELTVTTDEQDEEINDLPTNHDDSEIHAPPTGSDTPNKNIKVCPRYTWGRCPVYETCEFRHPPRCWSWLEKGRCSYKAKCRYHHPPLCRDSLNSKQCFNTECRYFHLKRTLRHKMEDEHLKDSLHAANYYHQNQQLTSPQTAAHYSDKPQISYTANSVHQHQPPQPQILNVQRTNPVYHPQPSQPPQTVLNHNDMSFLLQTIRDIKDELGRELADLKGKINTPNPPQINTTNTVPQPLITTANSVPPNLYMLPVHPQTLRQQ